MQIGFVPLNATFGEFDKLLSSFVSLPVFVVVGLVICLEHHNIKVAFRVIWLA